MTSLVDDLLDVSRVTRGLVELKREWLDVRDVVSEAVEQVTPLIQARHHQLALEPAEAPLVMGDRKRLVQVLANLLTNAAKYTHDGGRPNGAAAVLVAITGYGQEQDRARTTAAGFDHHLVKPVDVKKLQAILAAVGTGAIAL